MVGIFKDSSRNAYLLFVILAIAFLAIVSRGLFLAQPGDENVYYYMGKVVSEGNVPYKDFFYAHPPLQIYIFALIYKIFGFNIFILKSVPLISTLVSAFFVFKIAKERFGNHEALAASLLFLFSYSVMFNSVFSFGVEIATAFLVIGVYFLLGKNRYGLAGIFFALAAISRLLAIVPTFVILAFVFFSDKRNFLKTAATFASLFFIANIAFVIFFGNGYITDVYKFHLLKTPGARENIAEYIGVIKLNVLLFLSSCLFVFVKDKKRIGVFAVVSVIYLIFLLFLKRIFGFYFLVAFPFLAVIGGYSIVHLLNKSKFSKRLFMFFVVLLSLVFIWNLASDVVFLEKVGFTGFQRGKDIVEFIGLQPKEENLFGDASVVPLLAFLTDRKIALDFADTNTQVFASGVVNINETLAKLKGKNILFIIRSQGTISSFKEVKDFLNGNCEFLSQFFDKIEGSYVIYRCR